MPERFKVVCIPCKALYKCSALPLPFYLLNKYTAMLHLSQSRWCNRNISECSNDTDKLCQCQWHSLLGCCFTYLEQSAWWRCLYRVTITLPPAT